MREAWIENMRYVIEADKSTMTNKWIVVDGGGREGGRESADQTHSSAACNAQVNWHGWGDPI